MSYTRIDKHIAATAEQAVVLMAKYRISPTPPNFEIWYNYAGKFVPNLTRTIDDLIRRGVAFDDKQIEELHDAFFNFTAEGLKVAETASRLSNELRTLIDTLDKAGGDADTYKKALDEFHGAVGSRAGDDLQASIDRVLEATVTIQNRNSALEGRLDESSSEIRQLRQDLDDMRQEAFTDSLTAIANRKFFDQQMELTTIEATTEKKPLSLLMLDIDHFKKINDTHGHQTGDQVLKLLAMTMKEGVKGRDIPARYGGEEFCIILPDTRLDDATTLAENIRTAIGDKRLINLQTKQDLGKIAVSVGVSQFKPGEPANDFIHRADQALYHAKHNGRDRVSSERHL